MCCVWFGVGFTRRGDSWRAEQRAVEIFSVGSSELKPPVCKHVLQCVLSCFFLLQDIAWMQKVISERITDKVSE